jgi:Domain of unknown function (DUF4129)
MRELPGLSLAPAGGSRTGGAGRVAAAAVLLAVTAAGLQARGTFTRGSNLAAAGASGAVLAIVLSAAEGVALIAFIVVLVSVRPRRPRKDEEEEPPRLPFPWWAKVLGILLALAALVTPFAVLVTRKSRPITAARPLPGAAGVGRSGRLIAPSAGPIWPVITGMAIAVAVVLALVVLSRRRRSAGSPRNRGPRLTRLLDSLAAASDALNAGGEPREAIIACYAAMERGFAAAGSAPSAADTPAEVLARARRAGIIRSGPGELLTGLFRRARYSTQPMTSGDAGAAATALAHMRADLAASADAGTGP